jgi:hypothetical protein
MAKTKPIPHFFHIFDRAFRQQQSFLFALFVPMSNGNELNSLTVGFGNDDASSKTTDKTKRNHKK